MSNSEYTTIAFSITIDEKERLDRFCEENMLNRSKWFQRIVKEHLDAKEKETAKTSNR